MSKLKNSADNGDPQSMLDYAISLLSIKDPQNEQIAAKYLKAAADKKNIEAITCYAEILRSGRGVPLSLEESAKYYKLGADLEDPHCLFIYACLLDKGDGVEIDHDKANEYYLMAGEKGNFKGYATLGIKCLSGNDIEKNIEKGAMYLELASKNGMYDVMPIYA